MTDSPEDRQAHMEERLRTDIVAWFSTVRPDGRPHTVPIWFLWEGDTILFFTQPWSQKVRNLRNNPNVVLAIDDTRGGEDVVILEGTAALLDPSEASPTQPAYLEKYTTPLADLGWTVDEMINKYGFNLPVRITITKRLNT